MEDLLNNPVYNALVSADAGLSSGNERVKFFDEEVSPFAGFDENNNEGFKELYKLLPSKRKILYAVPHEIKIPGDWKLSAHIPGLQFVLDQYRPSTEQVIQPVPLNDEYVNEMIALTKLTKPGPFAKRTIEFGNYFGIFRDNRLAAMTGQRLHVSNFTEISAVCTHPDYGSKGLAAALLHHQVKLILGMGQIPFLHVRADNEKAIKLYEKTGFRVSRNMNFYLFQKKI